MIFLWATQFHHGAKASLLPVASQPPPKTWWWSCPQPPIISFSKFFSSLCLRAQPSTVFLGSHSLSLFYAIFLSLKVNIQNVDTIYICNSNFFQGLRSTLVITHKTFLYGHSCRELKNKQTQDIQAATFTLPKGEKSSLVSAWRHIFKLYIKLKQMFTGQYMISHNLANSSNHLIIT